MKIKLFGQGVVLVACLLLLFSSLTFAAEKDGVRIQGRVMELDLKKNIMVVNEKVFFWNSETLFYNENGSPVKTNQLKNNTWVYIEGVKGKNIRQFIIKKIYLLPKYIDQSERDEYPFMK